MILTVTDEKGRKAVLSAPAFPPSMCGRCSGFRAWFVDEGHERFVLRAAWVDADGVERHADINDAEWSESVAAGFAALGGAEFAVSDPGVGYIGG